MEERSVKLHDIVTRSTLQADGAVDCGTAFAISLAQRHQALLTALVYEVRLVARTEDERDEARLEAERARIRAEAERSAAAVKAAAKHAGIAHDVIVEQPSAFGIGEVLADYARVRDLAVVGVSGTLDGDARLLAETVLFGAGRPLILVPEMSRSFAGHRIMIAWDATPAVVHAIAGAMPLLQAAREVIVITVTDDKNFRRGQSGVELCRHLGRHGIAATFEAVERQERPVADALREAGAAYGIDLLVMGGYAHSTLRGLIFGSATRGILERPLTGSILMAH
jgi:nucleotide-binding universal stress UspA family protein